MLALDVPLVARLDHGGLYRPALEIGKDRKQAGLFHVKARIAERSRDRRGRGLIGAVGTQARTRLHAMRAPTPDAARLVRRERPESLGMGEQPLVRVVLPEQETMLRARREHAVGLFGSFDD